ARAVRREGVRARPGHAAPRPGRRYCRRDAVAAVGQAAHPAARAERLQPPGQRAAELPRPARTPGVEPPGATAQRGDPAATADRLRRRRLQRQRGAAPRSRTGRRAAAGPVDLAERPLPIDSTPAAGALARRQEPAERAEEPAAADGRAGPPRAARPGRRAGDRSARMSPMIQLLNRIALAAVRRTEVVGAFVVLAIVFMMIMPLPTALVDVLIAVNICVSCLLIVLALYLPRPLAFSSFPAVLLLTTMFRLALSIATTRLILLHQDAGHIVEAF